MHIVVGLLVAAVGIYWWARGSVILAIAASLAVLIAATQAPPIIALLVIVWSPYLIKRRSLVAPVSLAVTRR